MSDNSDEIIEHNHDSNGNSISVRGQRKSKIKGKWVRDNENVGGVPMEKANSIATELVGSEIDLRLPFWSELCMNWSKCYWMNQDDVVTTKIVCLLCRVPIFEPMFNTHMKSVHPSEDGEVAKLIHHFQQVRLARFYSASTVSEAELRTRFPTINTGILVEFLEQIGLVIDKNLDKPMLTMDRKRVSGKAPSLPQFKPELDVLDKVDTIFGTPVEEVRMMAEVMNADFEMHECLFFSRTAARFGPKCDYCYACHVLVRRSATRNHRKTAYHKLHKIENENLIQAIYQRLTDARVLKYSCANPLPIYKIEEICENDETLINSFNQFLSERGYIIDKLRTFEDEEKKWPYVSENAANLQFSDMDEDSKSSTSNCSSVSSTSSTTIVYEKPPVNYFVMDGIRGHAKVLESILELEEIFEQTGSLNQTQFAFVFGWASFNLVVSNGCKLSSLCNMKDQDFDNLQMINDTEPLGLIKFDAPKTGDGGFFSSWLILDRLTYDAFIFYRKVRDQVIREKGGRAHSFLFVSYFLKHLEARDVDHPINQFLRMCGVEWTFKAKHLTNAVNELIVRQSEKNSPEYALHYYKQLKLRSLKQKEVMESVEPHPFLSTMTVLVQKKVRKDKIFLDNKPLISKRSRKRENSCESENAKRSRIDLTEVEFEEPSILGEQLTPERGLCGAYAMTPPYLSTSAEEVTSRIPLVYNAHPDNYSADEPIYENHTVQTHSYFNPMEMSCSTNVLNPYDNTGDHVKNESIHNIYGATIPPNELEFTDL